MARIDELVNDVPSKDLQDAIKAELAELRKRVPFGLVYEHHLPEFAVVANQEIEADSYATPRDDNGRRLRVLEVEGDKAKVVENGADEPETVPVEELLAVRGLSEQIFPGLTSIDRVERAQEKPWHAVIEGENYHALQLLEFAYRGQVDCIYIDPPYNTGDTNWTYNNRYVDENDGWRHSKWLSFMEKRLRVAKRLLKPDGVLIVTVDEHEVLHLGMLLEDLFPEYLRYQLTIVNSARGNFKANFSRVEEYAFFCCPKVGHDVIAGSPVDYLPESGEIDEDPFEDDEPEGESSESDDDDDGAAEFEYRHARRRGPDSERGARPSMFYPVFIDEEEQAVVHAGAPISPDEEPDLRPRDGLRPIWPVDSKGVQRRWRWGRDRMQAAIEVGEVLLGKYNKRLDSWTINLKIPAQRTKNIKTVWRSSSHDAGTHGTSLLEAFLGKSRAFQFPKSVYATRDCIGAVCRNRPDALIVDFFGGSGTTLHATALLNTDGGSRRCILVTNNEVDGETATKLHRAGLWPGDEDYEARGVFEAVTRPRCKAALTGLRPDDEPVKGKYLDGRPFAEGLEDNCEFFKLEYLDSTMAELNLEFERLLPILWLAAGATGPIHGSADDRYSLVPGSPYALFSHPAAMRKFSELLREHPEVAHLFFITDSEDAYAEWSQRLVTPGRHGHMVPLDYMNFFRRFRA